MEWIWIQVHGVGWNWGWKSGPWRPLPFSPGHLVTWMTLTCIMVTKHREMILTDVSDTIHADSFALFALNIDILLADVTKPEKSKILTLTWPVTSSVTSGSNVWPCTGSSRTGLSNGVWNLEIGPVVWEISGGALCPPPSRTCYYPDPSRTCYYPDPSGSGAGNVHDTPKTIYRQQQPTRLGPLSQTPSVNGLGHSAYSTLSLVTTHYNFLRYFMSFTQLLNSYAHCFKWPVLLLTPLSPTASNLANWLKKNVLRYTLWWHVSQLLPAPNTPVRRSIHRLTIVLFDSFDVNA